MIIKDKIKLKSKTKSKILVLGFIVIILTGAFSFPVDVSAQATTPVAERGTCFTPGLEGRPIPSVTRSEDCVSPNTWTVVRNGQAVTTQGRPVTGGSAFENNISGCAVLTGDFDDCLVKLIYYIFYVIPSFVLNLIANFFNVIIALALSSSMYMANFITESWKITRDFSNIFFILILIYVAVQTILGIGHDTKKVIVQVVVMALLINFSMFFSKVVIDSSNILALVFYNKINVETTIIKDGTTSKRAYAPMVGSGSVQDKDISGGLVSKFDVTKLMTEDFFKKVRERSSTAPTLIGAGAYVGSGAAIGSFIPVVGTGVGALIGGITYGLSFIPTDEVPPGIMIGIILSAGFILIFAAYAFFVASFSFLGRLVELWVLIIFSPFAFMSWAIHGLDHMEYIGWASWIKRLLKTAFMAPIFMFFMYFIFKIANTNIWQDLAIRDPKDQGMIETLIFLFLPAAIILGLLKQATKFAKEGGGQVGEALIKGASVLTGLAVGGGIGLAAAGLQGSLGHGGKRLFENTKLTEWETDKNSKFKRFVGSRLRTIGGGDDGKGGLAGSSFDARRGIVGAGLKLASGATGFNLGAQSKLLMKEEGGYVADLGRRDALRKKRVEGLKVKEGEEKKQHLNELKEGQQRVVLQNEADLHKLDGEITSFRQKVSDLREITSSLKEKMSSYEKKKKKGGTLTEDEEKEYAATTKGYEESLDKRQEAAQTLRDLRNKKSAIKGGIDPETGKYRTHNSQATDKELDKIIAEAKTAQEKADADPTDIEKADTAKIAKALAQAARATKATTEAEKAERVALKNPNNKALTAAAELAKQQRDLALENAKEASKIVSEMAAADSKYKNAAQAVNDMSNNSVKGVGYSQDDFDDVLIPHAEHELKHTNDTRIRNYADSMEASFAWPWNEAARKQSAHEIRMGVKGDKHGGGNHGHGAGAGEHFIGDLLAATVAEKLVGGGDDKTHH